MEVRRDAFLNRCRRALLLLLLSQETATADDVRAVVDVPDGIDPVCIGAVFPALAKAGVIRAVGYAPSTRPERHANTIRVWAQADRAAALAWFCSHPDTASDAPASGDPIDATATENKPAVDRRQAVPDGWRATSDPRRNGKPLAPNKKAEQRELFGRNGGA